MKHFYVAIEKLYFTYDNMIFAHVIIGFLTFQTVINGEQVDHLDKTCELHVTNESRVMFTDAILHKKYNFMYMKLTFTDLNGTVKALNYVLCPDRWIWTYKGEGGGYEYLFLPRDFGYLSFGLLWSKSNSSHYPIQLYHHGNCSGLTIGENTSDLLVGQALGRMTSDIADRDDIYDSSYWCYYKMTGDRSGSMFDACENTICTLQTIEYRCCKFVISLRSNERGVQCSKQHYHFSTMWWTLPIVSGDIFYYFYPLFIFIVGDAVTLMFKTSSPLTSISESSSNEPIDRQFISLHHDSPVTFLSTLVSPFQKACSLQRTLCLRVSRILLLIVPLTLPAIGAYLDARYLPYLIEEAVSKGVVVDFSSMSAGFGHTGRFLYILGGPFIALTVHILFGILLLTIPKNFEKLLESGLFDPKPNGIPYFILRIPLKDREKLGRMSVRKHFGYKKVHNYLLIQLYMILNWKFWRDVLKIVEHRWKRGIRPKLERCSCKPFVINAYTVFILPFYAVFCVIELVVCFLYFAIPIVSCFFILINAYVSFLLGHFSRRPSHPIASMIVYISTRLLILVTVMAICLTWYIHCLVFFDGILLLSKVVVFTYMGIVQFPELSYGYIILVFMAFYYLMDSITYFGATYRNLLKHSIEISEKVQAEGQYEFARELVREHSIPTHLFEIIVEKHMPRRVQVFKTLIKAGAVIMILWISVDLLITFDKFQELSELSHVFTVLFISALPKICSVLCVKRHRDKYRQNLRSQLYLTVTRYCQLNGDLDSSSEEDDGAAGDGVGIPTVVVNDDENDHLDSLIGHVHSPIGE